MNKIFKKFLSAIMIILIVLPMSLCAFAVAVEPVTPEQAQKAILKGIDYKEVVFVDYTMHVENDGTTFCFMDVVVQLPDNTYAKYYGNVCNDYEGISCDRIAHLNTTADGKNIPLEKPLTMDEAVEYACKAYCVSRDDITLLTLNEYTNPDPQSIYYPYYYELTFSIGFSKEYRAKVQCDELYLDLYEWEPNSIEGKIGLFFRVLRAKIRDFFDFFDFFEF